MTRVSPLADRPGTFPCFSTRCSRRSTRGPASISMPHSAPAAITRAILAHPATRVLALDRDPDAIAAGAALAEAIRWPADPRTGSFRRSRCRCRATRPDRLRRHRARYRCFLDAARRARTRLFLPLRRPARHADGTDGTHRRRSRQWRGRGAAGRYSLLLRRGAAGATDCPRDRQRPHLETLYDHPATRRTRRPPRPRAADRHSSGDPYVPGAAHRRQRRTRRTRPRARCSRARSEARRSPRRRQFPLARRPAS